MLMPAPVVDFLLKTTLVDRLPAYLCVSAAGQLLHWGGHLSEYGIGQLQAGPIAPQVFFLEGLLPLNGLELFLPCLKTDQGRCADLYLFAADGCDWVLLLDATPAELQSEMLQQYRNQINLLQNEQTQRINRSLHPPFSTSLLPLSTEPQDLTILSASLRGLTGLNQQAIEKTIDKTIDNLFAELNLYLRTLMQAIVTEAGLIDRLLSDTVTACFGVLPGLTTAATHAIQAGFKMLTAVRQINHLRQAQQQPLLQVGIAIASGPIALGILGDRRYQVLGAIGGAVERATVLQQQSNPGEILIDANTFNQAIQMQQYFAAIDRSAQSVSEAASEAVSESISEAASEVGAVYSTRANSSDA